MNKQWRSILAQSESSKAGLDLLTSGASCECLAGIDRAAQYAALVRGSYE